MNHTVLPDNLERDDLDALDTVLSGELEIAITTSETTVRVPASVRDVLADAVAALVRGEAVTVEPHRTVLTTQEAADLLGITRPTLVRLLESGRIPFTSPGRHRRVELADVLAFRNGERTNRQQVLRNMATEATPDPPTASEGFVETR